jgi:hypothetical protein
MSQASDLNPIMLYERPQHASALWQLVLRKRRHHAAGIGQCHAQPCAHAMYVLEGALVTHRGRFGPGAFVWFPEGEVMSHGATADGDVTVLLVSNKPFSIQYVE